MKSNLMVPGFAVLFTIIYCINSIDGKNLHNIETKQKRQVEPLPDTKPDTTTDEQSQEKEEPSKKIDSSILATRSIYEETEAKNAGKVEENQRRSDSILEQNSAPTFLTNVESKVDKLEPQEERKVAEEPQPSTSVIIETPTTTWTSQIDKEVSTPVVPQANNKDDEFFKQPALKADDDVADIKPAASGIVTTAVKPTVPHAIEHQQFRPSYWSRAN